MFLILEGLDRTGKSTVANLYKSKGYEIVHLSAPDKKYLQPGYAGPSYLDDMLELIMSYDGKDVVFDRSWYGELIWPHVYGRKPMLTEDDIEILQEFESRNSAERILMTDMDTQGHWKRCVDNKEPLNINQFKIATSLFSKLAHKFNFVPRELKDYQDAIKKEDIKQVSTPSQQENTQQVGQNKDVNSSSLTKSSVPSLADEAKVVAKQESEAELLRSIERANTIRDLLSKRVLKQKGGAFDDIEEEIRSFLQQKLKGIFHKSEDTQSFSSKEVQLLKVLCKKLEEKDASQTRR